MGGVPGNPPSKHSPFKLPFGLVLPLCLLGTAAATFSVYVTTHATDDLRFHSAVQWTTDAIGQRIRIYQSLLRGAGALIAVNDAVDHTAFHNYVSRLNLHQLYPGIQAIGFARHIPLADRDSLLANIRVDAKLDFKLTPPGDREAYYPVVYIEPLDRRNVNAIGYDMFSDPVRRRAMERARDIGQYAASGKVTLIQEIDDQKQAGFLIYLPVYRGGTVPERLEERRKKILGFVYAPFRADDLFLGMFEPDQEPNLHFEVFDGTRTDTAARLHSSSLKPATKPAFEITSRVLIAGQPWTLLFQSTPHFNAASSRSLVWSILLTGLVLTAILVGITTSLGVARQRAEQAHHEALSQREEARKASEDRIRLASIVEYSDDAIISQDLDGTVTSWNLGAQRLFGYSADEIMGKSMALLLPPDRSGEDALFLSRTRAGTGLSHYETVRVAKSGAHVDVSVTVSPLRNASSEIVGLSKIARDITERKASERQLQKAREELQAHAANLEKVVAERTSRLRESVAELEAFSYSLSHDMRAPLRSILSYTSFVLSDYGQGLHPEAKEFLEKVTSSGKRLERLIRDVLSFTRISRQELVLTPVDVDELTRAIINERPELQAPQATIDIQGRLPIVLGHEASLTQVIANLLGNAVKFVAPGIQPRIKIHAENMGKIARIFVDDNGLGLDEEAQQHLFELFRRHHADGHYEGSGLGLVIVRKAIERMFGQVGVMSEAGKGSRFWFELPLTNSGSPLTPASSASARKPHTTSTSTSTTA